MVAELRAKTDAPMMECKKALTEAEGDPARAEEILRAAGVAPGARGEQLDVTDFARIAAVAPGVAGGRT
jgi:translation elongation factor EF-Ts